MLMPRQLLARLRVLMASAVPSDPVLPRIVSLVSSQLAGEVCSVYALRPGDTLELVATEGLRREAVGSVRLRVGEGIVGIAAASGNILNLPDAQNHPDFAFRPETGEASYASMLALPVRRAGRILGVLAVQHRALHTYDEVEVEVLETVGMVVAEVLGQLGAAESAEQSFSSALPRRFTGTTLVPGIVIGVLVLHGASSAPDRLLADDPIYEIQRLNQAVDAMQRDIDLLVARSLEPQDGSDGQPFLAASREVLAAYRMVAADAGWLQRAREHVQGGLTAEAAVYRVMAALRARMRRIADPYLRERTADIEDLAERLLNSLSGGPGRAAPPGSILLARRMGPADLLEWHGAGIAGLVIEEGSAAGHAAIIARALGLPAVIGVDGLMEAAVAQEEAVLNADEGQLVLRPEQELRSAFERLIESEAQRRAEWGSLRDRPATTLDGRRVRLMLNIGLPLELEQLALTGAEGIGLFRTEIPMLAAGTLLGQAEQTAIYRRVLDAAAERPVMFRTLDLGGDKLLPMAAAPEQENPAMGWRSLRVGLDRPLLLRRQLRALLEAGAGRSVQIMFPMVATEGEFRAARALLMAELTQALHPPAQLRVGAMLEVPALLWQLEALLPLVDFLSVGTNDLLQFLFACDRGAPSLSGRYDALCPPVLDLLEHLRDAAAAHSVELSVCGEIASRPLDALILVALGFEQLSMPAAALLPVKALLESCDVTAFGVVLRDMRSRAKGSDPLRAQIVNWAREQGLEV